MEITLTVCDVCADHTRPVRKFKVAELDKDGNEVKAEETARCAEHGGAFAALLDPEPRVAKKATSARGRRAGVTTMAEVEAARIPAKKAAGRGKQP